MTFISKQDVIALYPELTIDLQDSCIESDYYLFPGVTEHQKEAAQKAQQLSGWHKNHILEVCRQARPPLRFDTSVQMKITLQEWHQKCQWWIKEHDTNVDDLAKDWAKFMNSGQVDRLFEPLTNSKSGLIISAHDYNDLYE